MRPSVASETARAERKQFADDVEYYLSQAPRQLPSQYLYDELGSALFDAICRLPWYGITRTESHLLEMHAGEIFATAQEPSTLVELGPGSGEKLTTLLESLPELDETTVHLVDVSRVALETARRALEALPQVTVVTHQSAYEVGLAEVTRVATSSPGSPASPGPTLALFLGSNIGNFDPPGANAFLLNIRTALSAGDSLLLGADLVKPEPDLLLAYDDPLGVTAAFNRNLLVRVNRELDADFDIGGFTHRAVWEPEASRVEMHLVSLRQQRVRIPAARLDIIFEEGETIWTESSYKYEPANVSRMLEQAGFRPERQWIDNRATVALTLARAV